MCGIVGYVGPAEAADYLLEGLRRLEYRGYDSAGIVTINEGLLNITKTAGRVEDLALVLKNRPHAGTVGVGHTRWATHGPATDVNAHPHIDGEEVLALVHNGVVENFRSIKERLLERGCQFRSATDSEVIVQLIAYELSTLPEDIAGDADPYTPLVAAVQNALAQLQGTYGLAIVFRDWPDVIVAARLGSPLVIGVGKGENFVASDGFPLAGHTDKIVYLADHEIAVVTADTIRVIHRDEGDVGHDVKLLEIDSGAAELGEFSHYMLKEIFEQPETVRNAMRGRLDKDAATAKFGGLNMTPQQLQSVQRVVLTACGTSWHASLLGEYLIETLARIPVEVEYASELRYRNPPLSPQTLLFALTQSGETLDTLAALREMKRKGYPTMSICNVVGSTIAREADGGIYLHAGPEIGVASTKAFTRPMCRDVAASVVLRPAARFELRSGAGDHQRPGTVARPDATGPRFERHSPTHRREVCPLRQLSLPRSAIQFPNSFGRGPQAQGDQLRPCRRLPCRGNEAWDRSPWSMKPRQV